MVKRDATDERVIRYRDERTGLLLEKEPRRHPHIYWTPFMTESLRKLFPTSSNEEIAGLLGVSTSTLARKVKELGLRKDTEYLHRVFSESGRIGQARLKKTGRAHRYTSGHRHSEETKRKIRETMLRYHREHPDVMRRAWETRRSNQLYRNYEENRH